MENTYYQAALEDFHQARRQAAMQQLLARFTGEQTELLSYDDIRQKLKATNMRKRGLQEIPVDKIVGSVGRYKDFTRSFLPITISGERWARVKAATSDLVGLPPIEVYQLGDAYFVIDGNHRVSIAQRLEVPTISAYVTEVKTRVPFTADDDPEEIICKSRYAEFLEKTNLDKLRPEADLLMTFCAHYSLLLDHIDGHKYYMGLDLQQNVSYEDAVAHWYDEVYLPVVQMVREQGIMRHFPERTEADMYVLLSEHRAELKEALGWDVGTETAVSDIQRKKKPGAAIARVIEAVVPDELESGPAPGLWREERLAKREVSNLFNDILVTISGEPEDWRVLDQAIMMVQRENGRLLGVHVAAKKKEDEDQATVAEIRDKFEWLTAEAGIEADFSVEWGNVARQVVARAAFADLMMLALNCPPGSSILERLASGVQTILQRTPRPVLVVPTFSPMQHALLAYDGSPKAEEALFVATYLASRWQIQLSVVTVGGGNGKLDTANRVQSRAKTYLSVAGVKADYILPGEPAASALIEAAASQQADFMIMGGFGNSSMKTLMLGSTLNQVLLEYKQPILICR
ncbi:universal stress protein [Candidatus Leptofilum sp.]|uniref:universal stress protein n=1 Tax=Candidatus Leptofilum sp. TaxID=3241576 RepID=UPI003B5AF360